MNANCSPAALLTKFVGFLSKRLPKPAMFATIGAIGSLVGALLGEILAQAPSRNSPGASSMPTELCLLIDCSGSMQKGKLQEVIGAASSFAHRQDLSRNPMGVVAFSSTASPLVPLTSSGGEIERALAQLQAGGFTAMDLGLTAAATLLEKPMLNRKHESNQAVLLFTDGQPEDPSQALNSSLDIRERTRTAARSLRNAGTRIVAVATGDANVSYLAELTGDPSLVFYASQGGFDTAFRKAESAVYRRQLIDSTGRSYSAGMTLLRNVGWCVLVSLGLAFLLWGGQNAYLRRTPYTQRGLVTLVQGGGVAGLAAGFLAQAGLWVFSQASASSLLQHATFILAWGLLGALLGRGISAVVPNLKWQTALAAGAAGGLAAGATFLLAATALGDVAGRLVGAAILGAAIGFSIAFVEEMARSASLLVLWGPRETTTITLGTTPVTIGGGDDHVLLRGLAPAAYRVWVENGKVFCKDQQTGKQVELKDQSKFTVARVNFQVVLKQKEAIGAR